MKNQPTITFKRNIVYVNTGLIKCAPNMLFALFLVNQTKKSLVLQPCDNRERDAQRIKTFSKTNPKSRHINSGEFNKLLFEFMQWDVNCRYKITGNTAISNNETIVKFSLDSAMKFELPPPKTIVLPATSMEVISE